MIFRASLFLLFMIPLAACETGIGAQSAETAVEVVRANDFRFDYMTRPMSEVPPEAGSGQYEGYGRVTLTAQEQVHDYIGLGTFNVAFANSGSSLNGEFRDFIGLSFDLPSPHYEAWDQAVTGSTRYEHAREGLIEVMDGGILVDGTVEVAVSGAASPTDMPFTVSGSLSHEDRTLDLSGGGLATAYGPELQAVVGTGHSGDGISAALDGAPVDANFVFILHQ